MYWPDRGSGVPVEPARRPVASAVRQYFTEGGAGQAPTVPGGDWFNQITNELLNVLAAAGIDPSKTDDDQLLQAIQSVSHAKVALEALKRSYANAGYNVVGTFEAGFTFVNANDVGLHEASGKGYLGPAGPVAGGTDPLSGGFIPCYTVGKKYASLAAALTGDEPKNAVVTTESHYSGKDSGGARYVVLDSISGRNQFRCYLRADGKYLYLSPQNGVITIEQLGGNGSVIDGVAPTDDSWPAFYRAYQIKRENWLEPIEFEATLRTYKLSKPLLMNQGMALKSCHVLGSFIYYVGGTVTTSEVPPVTELGGNVMDYSTIQAEAIFVQPAGEYCKYANLSGFDFTSTGDAVIQFGLYHRYLNRSNVDSCRFKNGTVGQFGIDVYTNKFEDISFIGHSSVPAASIMSQIYPRGGYSETTIGSGTSNIWERCGGSKFKKTWEHVNHHYSIFNACYSEAGTDIVMNMIRCRGVVFNGYGVEGLRNVTSGIIRANGSSIVINGLDFAYDNTALGDSMIHSTNGGSVSLGPISFDKITATTGTLKLAYVDATSKMDASPVLLPSSIGVGLVSGKLSCDTQVDYTGTHITTSTGTPAVTETVNNVKYVHKGKVLEISIEITWTASSQVGDLYISSLPFASERSIAVSGLSSGLPANTTFVASSSGSNLRAVNAATGAGVAIPVSGTILLNFSYQIA